jgi:Amt family ammonium transporter
MPAPPARPAARSAAPTRRGCSPPPRLVLLMTPGLSFFYGGMVRRRTSLDHAAELHRHGGDLAPVGRRRLQPGLRRQPRRFHRRPAHLLHARGRRRQTHATLSPTVPLVLFALFQLKFAIITPALITGSFAERVRFSAYVLFMVLFTLLIYAPLAHWTWHPDGFLRKLGRARLRRRHGGAHEAGFRRAGRRHRARAAPRPPRGRAPTRPATSRTCCSARACCGSAGSASTPARRSARLERGRPAFADHQHRVGRRDAGLDVRSTAARQSRRRRWARASAPSSGLVAITPAAGFVTVGHSMVIGVVGAAVSNVAVALAEPAPRSTTRSTSSRATASAAWSACCSRPCSPRTSASSTASSTTMLVHLLALVIVAGFTARAGSPGSRASE